MEFHYGKPKDEVLPCVSSYEKLPELFVRALVYVDAHHESQLAYYRGVSLPDLTPWMFWSEYVWCVYAAGLSARVVTSFFDKLMNSLGPWDVERPYAMSEVLLINGNEIKCASVFETRRLMKDLGWDKFKSTYCVSPTSLQDLSFIGKVTKFHLARNIGIDCVKPDIHLTRLASYYNYSPSAMCEVLGKKYNERVGVVDFILWAYCAAVGTKEICL